MASVASSRFKYLALKYFLPVMAGAVLFGIYQVLLFREEILSVFGESIYLSLVFLSPPVIVSALLTRLLFLYPLRHAPVRTRLIIQFLLHCIVFQASLVCWSAMDITFRDYNYELSPAKIIEQYFHKYTPFIILGILIPGWIAGYDYWYRKMTAEKEETKITQSN